MIAGYAANASVGPGERLVLHVATDAARFRVRFYRYGDGLVPMHASAWLAGKNAAGAGADDDWNWPSYSFWLARAWPSAVYIAHLQQADTDPDADAGACPAPELSSTSATLLFVVRGSGRGDLLYKLPMATYQAYNHTGGGCFYDAPPRSLDPPGAKVSFRRPGGGIGGHTFGAPDHYDASSPRQTFAHWDAPFIGWLSRNGYTPEFCTDLDLHHNPALLQRYRLMLSVGHDEYWSTPMRDAVEDFIGAGGNVAFFSANLCWWRIHIVDAGGAMVCHQGGPLGALDHWWPASGAKRPEDALCGVSYRHGGGWWDGARACGGYRVQLPGHWAFAGTGLQRGDAFGQHSSPPLVGYECDGAPLQHFDHASGIATLSPLAQAGGTPPGYALLAAAELGSDWQERPPREPALHGIAPHAATMGVFTRGGTVFTAGTTDWAQVLGSGQDQHVERITHNVIAQLLTH